MKLENITGDSALPCVRLAGMRERARALGFALALLLGVAAALAVGDALAGLRVREVPPAVALAAARSSAGATS